MPEIDLPVAELPPNWRDHYAKIRRRVRGAPPARVCALPPLKSTAPAAPTVDEAGLTEAEERAILAHLLIKYGPGAPPNVRAIVAATADECNIPLAALLRSDRRLKPLIEARHVAVFLACELTHASLPQIGRAMGRDHTTILNARDRIRARLPDDVGLAALVARVRKRLDAGETVHG